MKMYDFTRHNPCNVCMCGGVCGCLSDFRGWLCMLQCLSVFVGAHRTTHSRTNTHTLAGRQTQMRHVRFFADGRQTENSIPAHGFGFGEVSRTEAKCLLNRYDAIRRGLCGCLPAVTMSMLLLVPRSCRRSDSAAAADADFTSLVGGGRDTQIHRITHFTVVHRKHKTFTQRPVCRATL